MNSNTAVVLCATACFAGTPTLLNASEAEIQASASRLEADVRFLADDLLEGREAGTRGYDLAALYVAEAYRAIGLVPGGDDGTYFHQVPLVEDRKDPDGVSTLSIALGDTKIELVENEDYFVFSRAHADKVVVEAPAVFAGLGFTSDRYGRDDYSGLDVDGKVVVQILGAPKYLNSEERAHFSGSKWIRASDLGAVGSIGIYSESFEKRFPFPTLVNYYSNTSSMSWLDDTGQPFSQSKNIQASAAMSLEGGEKLFESTDYSWAEIIAAVESEAGEVPSFDLGMTARIEIDSVSRRLTSPNVVGILEGSDPELRDEYLLLIGHLDHDGIRPSEDPDDDEIFNGAMDNAVGISAMLEVGRMLAENPPKRSVIFIALTAEEKGLIGSDFFARNPTVPQDSIVAVVNLDMPIVTFDFTDVVAFGAERSTLFPVVEAAAAKYGVNLSPDPNPDEGFFTRSDHYSFVKQGVPSVYLDTGHANGGKEAQADFLQSHYHKVSDEVVHVHFAALAKFTQIKFAIAEGIANMDERPVWKRGDFFGLTFGGPMQD